MFRLASLFYALPVAALACGDPVCVVDPTGLGLQRIITFEDQTSHMGPGRLIDEPLHIEGAKFGERFAGQDLLSYGNHDVVSGEPKAPLQVVPGAKGQNLSIVAQAAFPSGTHRAKARLRSCSTTTKGSLPFKFGAARQAPQRCNSLPVTGAKSGGSNWTP